MYFDPKSPAYLSTQESPSFVGIQTPGLRSPSLFINDKGYGPSSVTSPEKKPVAKSDMIYISKTQLENELHHFVATLVQQKSVNENDTLYYLDQLKNSVLNLIKENTRLQQTPQSARGGLSSQHSPREERLVNQKDEDMLNQKNFYEEKIHANSLHIAKLEQKINDLVLQSQGLMRINHELSTQMLQMSHPAHPAREESEQMSSNRSDRLREINVELENNLNYLKNENQKLHAILEKNRFDLETIHKERDILKFELTKAFQQLKEQAESNNHESQELYPRAKDLNQKASSNNEIETQSFGTGDLTKSQTKENIELKHIDLMKKQLSDYKAANAILHKKTEKYLLQIEDLNEALKLTNYNLEVLQNRYITLEKELVNKNRLEAIMSSYMNVISKLEVKIQSITEENAILQKVNEENIIVISELKSQLEQPNEGGKQEECESPFFATPDTKRKVINESTQADHSGRLTLGNQSATKAPETVLLEQELTKKKFEEKVENILHEKELEMRAERIKHKNQIEKYNANLEVLSKKIQALVTVNEGLAKDLEILKIEFSNYRTISWSVIQEVRVHLDSFKKHDFEISKGLSEIEAGNGKGLEKLKQAYGELRRDVMNADEVIEERRKFL